MLEIKFGHELNVQRYTWHARLPDNAIHMYKTKLLVLRHFYTGKIVSK